MPETVVVPIRYLEADTPSGLRRDEEQDFEPAIADFLERLLETPDPWPDPVVVRERVAHVLAQISPNRLANQANSPHLNKNLTIVSKDTPPYFGVGTSAP